MMSGKTAEEKKYRSMKIAKESRGKEEEKKVLQNGLRGYRRPAGRPGMGSQKLGMQ